MKFLISQVFINKLTALVKSDMMQYLFWFWNLDLKPIFKVYILILLVLSAIFFSCCLHCVCFSYCLERPIVSNQIGAVKWELAAYAVKINDVSLFWYLITFIPSAQSKLIRALCFKPQAHQPVHEKICCHFSICQMLLLLPLQYISKYVIFIFFVFFFFFVYFFSDMSFYRQSRKVERYSSQKQTRKGSTTETER